jgi:hypothetical protein
MDRQAKDSEQLQQAIQMHVRADQNGTAETLHGGIRD